MATFTGRFYSQRAQRDTGQGSQIVVSQRYGDFSPSIRESSELVTLVRQVGESLKLETKKPDLPIFSRAGQGEIICLTFLGFSPKKQGWAMYG